MKPSPADVWRVHRGDLRRRERVSLNAAVGPSFANVGTTFSTMARLDVKLTDRAALVGEFGAMPREPFRDAAEIAAPGVGGSDARVNAYHWNGNLKVRPFEIHRLEPYLTGGFGSVTSDTVITDVTLGTTHRIVAGRPTSRPTSEPVSTIGSTTGSASVRTIARSSSTATSRRRRSIGSRLD